MKATRIFEIVSIVLLLFSVFLFIISIKECATDEEISQVVILKTEILDDNQIIKENDLSQNVKTDESDKQYIVEKYQEKIIDEIGKVKDEQLKAEEQKKDKEEQETIVHIHNKHTIYTEPDCYRDGEEKIICKDCGFVFKSEKIERLKHQWEEIYTVKATPISDGEILYRCNLCFNGKEEKIKFNAIGKTNLFIQSINLNVDVVMTECNQENTNNYDVCCDMNFINKENPLFWGHSTRSLRKLYEVKVGDIIYFTHDNKVEKYIVTISEEGNLVDGETNIMGKESGQKCISKCEKETLHFFTCYQTPFNINGRWMVFAEKIE